MASLVYVLCTLTSLMCSFLLLRTYRATGARLLLWSGLCFFLLGLNGAALFADLVVYPDVNLLPLRRVCTLGGLAMLLWGLVWESGS